MDKQVETGVGPCIPVGDCQPILLRWWTETRCGKVYIHGERIAGLFGCPKCTYDWPLIQSVEEWTDNGKKTKDGLTIMEATGWGLGVGECPDCQLVVCEGFDESYAIDLS